MKKLSLNELKPVKVLSRNDQKNVKGGVVINCSCNGVSQGYIYCTTTADCVASCSAICAPKP
ncbi:hypothetical protein SIO70_32075 [Chitinophaga sancti]|uniref:hypothetical protein n=1 Tax=Chitinophaga sancti TaxID=1004 RepID=UPI002A74C024|nr:hypothetical protein [Chitinophaga sancti]WPQ63005.1 hypothetical protein SIO70_32075 [Chitinophaga sancti]